jgi:putative endonuclease
VYYVYVLQCGDGKFYTGYTADLKKRVRCHEDGAVPSTKPRRPVQLVFYEASLSPEDARRREAYLKTTAGKRALKLMLREWLKHPTA